jgi:hypothetical protein
LQITAGALAGCTLQVITTICAIGLGRIGWTLPACARTGLLGIALPGTSTADGLGGGELTAATAIFVGIVADGPFGESASRGIAARVASATFHTATVAVFALLDDTITALLSSDEGHFAVVGQTLSVDRVPVQSAANVADRAWREVFDARRGGRIHDESATGIAGIGRIRATSLRIDKLGIAT